MLQRLALLLWAACALAATPPYPYHFLLPLDPASGLIHYSPTPVWYGENATNTTHTTNTTNTTNTAELMQRSWSAGDVTGVWTWVGGSFSLTLPSGSQVSVYGALHNGTTVTTTVDGVPIAAEVNHTESPYVRWLTLTVPGGPGPHNLTVSLSGTGGVRQIWARRPNSPDSNMCSSWDGITTNCYKTHFDGWEPSSELRAMRKGTWIMMANDRAVTREEGASVVINVRDNSSWIELEGWSDGVYEVRCTPAPPNATTGEFGAYWPGSDSDRDYSRDVVLYAAELDPRQVYKLELIHRSYMTGVRRLNARVWVPPPPGVNKRAIGIGVGVGVGTPLVLGLVYWWWRRRRQKRRARTQAAELGVPPHETKPLAEKNGDEEEKDEGQIREEDGPSATCVVCLDKRPMFAVAECGHLCMCSACCKRIMAGGPRCPVCNTDIVQRPMRIYQP